MVFTVLGAVAELERSLTVERVRAGLRNAKAKGKCIGRPAKKRLRELSLYGRYLDCSAPLAVRSQVLLKIYRPDDYFEASATVIYANPSSGLGWRSAKSNLLSRRSCKGGS